MSARITHHSSLLFARFVLNDHRETRSVDASTALANPPGTMQGSAEGSHDVHDLELPRLPPKVIHGTGIIKTSCTFHEAPLPHAATTVYQM